MTEQQMNEALDAIYDEAEGLLEMNLPEEVAARVELILSLARYKFDVLSDEERGSSERSGIEDQEGA